jgi:hypothetical protein
MSFDKTNEMNLDQSHDKVPPALIQVQTTRKSAARPLKDANWEPYKQAIKDIYITKNASLPESREAIEAHYNFKAW